MRSKHVYSVQYIGAECCFSKILQVKTNLRGLLFSNLIFYTLYKWLFDVDLMTYPILELFYLFTSYNQSHQWQIPSSLLWINEQYVLTNCRLFVILYYVLWQKVNEYKYQNAIMITKNLLHRMRHFASLLEFRFDSHFSAGFSAIEVVWGLLGW